MRKLDLFDGKKHIHFIGIGGSGMIGLVQICHQLGYEITGSDHNETENVKLARAMGVPVNLKQCAENVRGSNVVVYTDAISEDNEELKAAKADGEKLLLTRGAFLGALTKQFPYCISIAGTHGKTTASSMLAEILIASGKDPNYVIGGKLHATGNYGYLGDSDMMVCEACEFKDNFLKLDTNIAVILNIDRDHMDYFKTIENLKASFFTFAEKANQAVVYCGDDANTVEVVSKLKGKRLISFGFHQKSDYYPAEICQKGMHTEFVLMNRQKSLGKITLHVPGRHNILNALAAAAASIEVGADERDIAKGLAYFRGAGRRFEYIGEKNGISVIDDYAHHPAEIAVTLKAAKTLGYRKVWALHQPFTYSRTKLLLDDFAEALQIADKVVLTEIMGGREKDTGEIKAEDLAAKIKGCVCLKTQKQAAAYILQHAEPGDVVLTLGCGDIYKAAVWMVNEQNVF